MYSNQLNVCILTAVMAGHGVRHAVVCPGSRNAPIVHNFSEHPDITCHPVTDERSAGFIALGMAQALRQPVAVCVTSGSALLNVAPAVAEAFYQHLPLVIISADRPEAWIDQLDGQTIRQREALANIVCRSVALPENASAPDGHWHCNRLVNEALLACRYPQPGPVHINVPLAEPLFGFDNPSLPDERIVSLWRASGGQSLAGRLWQTLTQGHFSRPMVIVGQAVVDMDAAERRELISGLSSHCVVVSERLCNLPLTVTHFEEVLSLAGDEETIMPDLIIYMGDMLVSKQLRHFLRRAAQAQVVMVSADGQLHDTAMHAVTVVEAEVSDLMRGWLHIISEEKPSAGGITSGPTAGYIDLWRRLQAQAEAMVADIEPPYSQLAAVKYFEQQLDDMEYDFEVHYANSMAVRLGNIFAAHPIWCNRGVNGIEGSLSTAAGYAAVCGKWVFCVIGDLSFFYDQNALWNQNLQGNLRIILLNNGKGGIFNLLPGLEHSPARDALVSGQHHTSAQGICTQHDIGYLRAVNMAELQMGMVALLTEEHARPMLLEVMTDAEADAEAMRIYHNLFKTK